MNREAQSTQARRLELLPPTKDAKQLLPLPAPHDPNFQRHQKAVLKQVAKELGIPARIVRPTVLGCLFVLWLLTPAAAQYVCPPTHFNPAHAVAVPQIVAQPQAIVANPYAYFQPLVAPAGLAGTVYGYSSQPAPQQLQANPYRLNPAEMLRDAQRLTESTQKLTSRSLDIYERFGADALAIEAETEQLRARAALIEATLPPATPLSAAPLVQRSTEAQTVTAGGQTICVEPDGRGGFMIRVTPGAAADPLPAPAASAEEIEPQTHPGVFVLATHCARCHTAPNAQGGIELFAAERQLNGIDAELAEKILESIRLGNMPKSTAEQPAEPLTDLELAHVRTLLGGS